MNPTPFILWSRKCEPDPIFCAQAWISQYYTLANKPIEQIVFDNGTIWNAATIASQIPLRRLAVPEDHAQAMLFLASDAAAYINGVVLDVNGGRVMM